MKQLALPFALGSSFVLMVACASSQNPSPTEPEISGASTTTGADSEGKAEPEADTPDEPDASVADQTDEAKVGGYSGPSAFLEGSSGSPNAGVPPLVERAKAKVEGELDADIVHRIVGAHIIEVRRCYEAGLRKHPKLSGRIAVEFTIGADGKIRRAVPVDSDDFEDHGVPTCVAEAVSRWIFPKPADGGEVVVNYTFEVRPGAK